MHDIRPQEVVDPWSSEQIITCHDKNTGLRAVVAIDDTTLGPGFGGVRLGEYPTAQAAIVEAQRLAAAMTLKHALAELPYGGAKSVIMLDGSAPTGAARERLFAAFGQFLARSPELYIPGVDMGTTLADMVTISDQGVTVYCAEHEPSPWTARGVHAALRAGAAHTLGTDDLAGVRISIQGAGSVGAALARLVAADGARVLISDIDSDRADRVAESVDGLAIDPGDAPFARCDIFAPCAIARVVTADSVDRLQCRLIIGAANDALDSPAVADLLHVAGITVVPDYVANAGGAIHEHARAMGWDEERLAEDVDRIGERVTRLLQSAQSSNEPPATVAGRLAAERLAAAGDV
ncbi:MAG: Glu/Leu/Phe/Val dehydrogenase dimerization domain-containing protein [Micrococcales bacterium]|nr:Glu/Leu/Phe/Val dehydrogenase dimerization domain-containing protein [Micrococcales bacterium]